MNLERLFYMLEIGVQTHNVIDDENPLEGFEILKQCGFNTVDFSLNYYLKNTCLYKLERNDFFDKSMRELKEYFTLYKEAAKKTGIRIHQMHMPYPLFVPNANKEFNDYLMNIVAFKSLELCAFLECKYIVIHGFKLNKYLGSRQAEWNKNEEFLHKIAPIAKDLGIVICLENLYDVNGNILEGICCDARLVSKQIDRLNEKYNVEVFGFCFDTGHANLINLDFYDFISVINHRLKVLHIHDNDGVFDLHQLPFIFTRNRENKSATDWNGFIEGLKHIKFNGVLNFETAPVLTSFPEQLKPQVLKFIADIGRYFISEIEKVRRI